MSHLLTLIYSKFQSAAIAKQKAEELNSKLNYLPSAINFGAQEEQQLEYFEEELEINDFPQQIRYRICSRESIAQIQEFADVGISVKGLHYPPGREPKEGGERKLYLFLEARDQVSLKRAKDEILRIMKDALRQMVRSFWVFWEGFVRCLGFVRKFGIFWGFCNFLRILKF